jgi:hypothetical protein
MLIRCTYWPYGLKQVKPKITGEHLKIRKSGTERTTETIAGALGNRDHLHRLGNLGKILGIYIQENLLIFCIVLDLSVRWVNDKGLSLMSLGFYMPLPLLRKALSSLLIHAF